MNSPQRPLGLEPNCSTFLHLWHPGARSNSAIRTGEGRTDELAQELAGRRSVELPPGDQKNLDDGGMRALAAAPVNLGLWVGQQMLQQRFAVLGGARTDKPDDILVMQCNGHWNNSWTSSTTRTRP